MNVKALHQEIWAIDRLRPNAWNPNVVDNKTMELTKLSIMEEGFSDPIDVDPTGLILDGEHRWRVALDLGMTEIPVFVKERYGDDAVITTIRKDRTHGEPDLIRLSEIVGDLVDALGTDEVDRRLGYDEVEQRALIEVSRWDWDAYNVGDEDALREEREEGGVTWSVGLAPGVKERLDKRLPEYSVLAFEGAYGDTDLGRFVALLEDARRRSGLPGVAPIVKET